jgi:hypothetical protein
VTRPPSVAYLPVFARNPEVMTESRARLSQQERAAERRREIEATLRDPGLSGPARAELERSTASWSTPDVGTQLAHNDWELDRRVRELKAQILGQHAEDSDIGHYLLRYHALAPQYQALVRQREAVRLMHNLRVRRCVPATAERVTATFILDRGQA